MQFNTHQIIIVCTCDNSCATNVGSIGDAEEEKVPLSFLLAALFNVNSQLGKQDLISGLWSVKLHMTTTTIIIIIILTIISISENYLVTLIDSPSATCLISSWAGSVVIYTTMKNCLNSHFWKQTWIVCALLPFEHRHLALLPTNALHCVLSLESLPEQKIKCFYWETKLPNWNLPKFFFALSFTLSIASTVVLKQSATIQLFLSVA